jgi:hypothetical protein
MKTRHIIPALFALTAILLFIGLMGCEDVIQSPEKADFDMGFTITTWEGTLIESAPVSDGGITPYILDPAGPGGNVTCDMVADAFETEFAFSSGKFNYVCDEISGECVWIDDDDNTYPDFPLSDLNVTITDNTYVSFDGKLYIDGKYYCVAAVIVKGRDDANVYYYEGGTESDSGLAAPEFLNPQGRLIQPELSNLTFCFVECDNGNGECQEETAWGGDSEGKGSAWWYYYDASIGGVQTVWAGQHIDVGTVEVVGGVVTIVLTGGWELQNVDDPVKIKGYSVIPEERPVAGLFTGVGTYKGDQLTNVDIGEYNFYAIHLDVQLCE